MGNPVSRSGAGSPQSIYQVSTVRHHDIGEIRYLRGGRAFAYARNTGAAIDPGKALSAEVPGAPGDITDMAVGTIALGATSLTGVTLNGSTESLFAGEYAGGFIVVNDDTGEGYSYLVEGHEAIAASGSGTIRIFDEVRSAIGASATVTLQKTPWHDTLIKPAGAANVPAGVAQVTIAASAYSTTSPAYYWVQTWGPTVGWADASSIAVGSPLQGGATAGQFELAAEGAGTLGNTWAVVMVATVDTEYRPIFLKIAC